MPSTRDRLVAAHREIDVALDLLARSLDAGVPDLDAFRRAWDLCREHYPREQRFLETVHPRAARKLANQHAEVLEIAMHAESSPADAIPLLRRFVALAQHNIIEAERDVFPLAD